MTDAANDTDFSSDQPTDDEEGFRDDGSPTLASLANAIQVWTITNWNARAADWPRDKAGGYPPDITVGETAMAFCLPPARIAAAVEHHYWMFLGGDGPIESRTIYHEGE